MLNYYRSYVARFVRFAVLAVVAVTSIKFILDVSPTTLADSGCPYGFSMAHVIGRNYSTCAPVGSITSWGAVEPGAVISKPGTSWADPHAPEPYGDGGRSYYYPTASYAGYSSGYNSSYYGYPAYGNNYANGYGYNNGYNSSYQYPSYGYNSYYDSNFPRYYY
jgi:hypothetical protein